MCVSGHSTPTSITVGTRCVVQLLWLSHTNPLRLIQTLKGSFWLWMRHGGMWQNIGIWHPRNTSCHVLPGYRWNVSNILQYICNSKRKKYIMTDNQHCHSVIKLAETMLYIRYITASKKYPNAELVSSKPRCKTHWHLYVLWVLFLLLGPFSRNLISVFQTLRHCQQYIHHAYTNHSFLLLLTAQWKLTYILSNSLSTYLNRYSSVKDPTIKPVDSICHSSP